MTMVLKQAFSFEIPGGPKMACATLGAIHLSYPQGGRRGSGGRMWSEVKPHVEVHTEN